MILSLPKRDWGTWSMLREYLRHRKTVLYFYLLVIVFLPLVQFLSNLPLVPMLYGIGIVTFLLGLGMLADGISFRQKNKLLAEIRGHLSDHHHYFPPAANVLEEEYQGIISGLYEIIEANHYQLERAHNDRVEYYTMWVHQIKTPIAAIRLLQSGEDNPVLERELFKIEEYAEMALKFVKLSDLQSDLVIRCYKLEDVIKDSVRKYATLFIQKKLSVSIAEMDVSVETDSKWLSFIIEQLLSNAIKYTAQGGVKFYWQDNALVIEDSGIGINSRDIQRIFEKGYTGYNGRLDKRASGIGLYMAKKVADSLSIQLKITSEAGRGTRASLRFPRHLKVLK